MAGWVREECKWVNWVSGLVLSVATTGCKQPLDAVWILVSPFRCSDFFLASFSMCSTFRSKYKILACGLGWLCTSLCVIQPLLSTSGAVPCFTLDACAEQLENLQSALALQMAWAVGGMLRCCPASTTMSQLKHLSLIREGLFVFSHDCHLHSWAPKALPRSVIHWTHFVILDKPSANSGASPKLVITFCYLPSLSGSSSC